MKLTDNLLSVKTIVGLHSTHEQERRTRRTDSTNYDRSQRTLNNTLTNIRFGIPTMSNNGGLKNANHDTSVAHTSY